MAKVYVTQENSRLNYSDAERFGEILFVTSSEYSPNINSKRNETIESEIKYGLCTFDLEKDFLLLSGDPIITALAFHKVAGSVTRKVKVNLLKWDGQSYRYNQISVWAN